MPVGPRSRDGRTYNRASNGQRFTAPSFAKLVTNDTAEDSAEEFSPSTAAARAVIAIAVVTMVAIAVITIRTPRS